MRLLIILALAFVLVGCVSQAPIEPETPIEVPEAISTVSFRQVVSLAENQSMQLEDHNVTVKVRRFIYSPCTFIAPCDWSGRALHVEIMDNGERTTAELVSANFTYQTEEYIIGLVDSDFINFAQLAFFPPDAELRVRLDAFEPETIIIEPPQ